MARAESAKDASYKGHNLTVLFIYILKIFVSQKVLGFVCVCVCVLFFFFFFWPVYGPEKILSLATPTLQSQPVRK